MQRRKFIQKSAALALLGSTIITQTMATTPPTKAFIHHVYFWLANPDSKEDVAQLIAALKKLSKVPDIKEFHIGVPADTNREVIDSSYQVSWCVFFNNPKDQEVYQTHSIHLTFVEENKHLWKKVVVYDSIDV